MPKIQIQAVALDYGNVLSHPQDQNGVARLAELAQLSANEFGERYTRNRLAYDRGVVTGAEYWNELLSGTDVLPTAELIAELIRTDVTSWLRIDNRLMAWARRLRVTGISLAILSNMPRDVLEGLRNQSKWLSEFAITIFSCEVGSVKPEARIYRLLLDALECAGPSVLFIDDSHENIQAATDAGLTAVRYRSIEALQQEVGARFELPVPEDVPEDYPDEESA
jgi:putative hydrolase of the HAD superfamily